MYKGLICVAIAISAYAGTASADPRRCYHCEDGPVCDDPVNIEDLPDRDCEKFLKSNVFGTLTNVPIPGLDSRELVPLAANGSGATCLKRVISNGSHKTTARHCAYKVVDGLETCTFLKNFLALPDEIRFTCSTCDTDFCNSSSTIMVSILSFVGLLLVLFTRL